MERLPDGLYIPPDALEIFLDRFSGPLDLLLWLIRRNRMDIRDIPVAEVTKQYLGYLEEARRRNLELAADYLLMAAWLAEIKARMLLPVPETADDEALDPREELARRLAMLAEVQARAEAIDTLPRAHRDFFYPRALAHDPLPLPPPRVALSALLGVWQGLQDRDRRTNVVVGHQINRPILNLRQRMMEVLAQCRALARSLPFAVLLQDDDDRLRLGLTLLAVLELLRQQVLILEEAEASTPEAWTVRHVT